MIISRRSASTREPGGGIPECSASTVAAIASLSVDAAGKRAFAFHAAPEPPGEALDVVRRPSRVAADQRRASFRARHGVEPRTRRRAGAPPRGRPNTSWTCADERRPPRAIVVTRTVTSPSGSATRSEKRRPLRAASTRASCRSQRRRPARVPRAARPVTSPYDTWCGAGCSIAGGGSAAIDDHARQQ